MSDWKVPVICAAVAIVAAVSYVSSGSADALSYRSSWGDTLEEARNTGKPILLYFGGDW